MSSRVAPDVDLSFPDLELELVEDISPPAPAGFLRLVRRRLRVRFPDGERSEPFAYDELDRRALDAVVIAAHFAQAGERWVYLRSALRPPLHFRDPQRSPTGARETGALWELPAGLIEPDEQSLRGVMAAGRRELREELGFAASEADFQWLGPSLWPCPGVLCERLFFLQLEVRPEERAEPSLDGSALERHGRVLALPLDRALELCRTGRIEDAKTELGLRRLAEALSGASGARSNE
jgi:ADP-ribose pyrophosphatase